MSGDRILGGPVQRGSLEDPRSYLELDLGGVATMPQVPQITNIQQIMYPNDIRQSPPCCPYCSAMLHPVDSNERGDILFECLNDHPDRFDPQTGRREVVGYQAIFRMVTRQWDEHPNSTAKRWAEPIALREVQRRAGSQHA